MNNEELDTLIKEKNYAYGMLMKYTSLLKEWQHNLITAINQYCENQNASDFVSFVHQYEIVYLNYRNWFEKYNFLKWELIEYGKSNNADIQN